MTRSKRTSNKNDVIFNTVNISLILLLLFIFAYPLYFTVIASISDPYNVLNGKVFLYPVQPTLEAFQNIVGETRIWIGYRNTLIYTTLGTMFNLLLSVPAAYVLSKKKLPGRSLLSMYFIFTMMFSGGMIPTYLQMKSLNLINKWYTLIIFNGINVYNMIVAKTYFQNSIPEDLYEAGRIDGASEIRNFISIALPLSKPILAVIALYYAVAHWNTYFFSLIYITSEEYIPLQVALRNILFASQQSLNTMMTDTMDAESLRIASRRAYMAEGMKYALIFISSAPLLIAYPFVQKHFVKGVMIGSIKG